MPAPRGDDLAERIGRVLSRRWGVPVAVGDLRRLSGGSSRETWSFDATVGDDGSAEPRVRPLVLQRERPGGARAATGMGVEARLVRAAGAAGVAVPEVVAAQGDDAPTDDEPEPDLGGPWLIAGRIEGETIARRILRDDAYAGARAGLAAACGGQLAAIHAIAPESVPGLDGADPVAQYTTLLDQLGQPHPALELGLRWLGTHRPPPGPVRVVHGDFRLGNLVVGPDGLRAVLDWELAHLGDPVEDLGWLCVRAWRFGGSAPVGGFGERSELLAAYEAAGGGTVAPDALHWWEVMGTVKWGVICVMQTTSHLLGLSRSVELAAIGRRVCETEHDVLELLP